MLSKAEYRNDDIFAETLPARFSILPFMTHKSFKDSFLKNEDKNSEITRFRSCEKSMFISKWKDTKHFINPTFYQE